jgi:hypothetical protein
MVRFLMGGADLNTKIHNHELQWMLAIARPTAPCRYGKGRVKKYIVFKPYWRGTDLAITKQ